MKASEIVSILDHLQPGLATKEVVSQADCFVFLNGWVISYNDEVSVRAKLDLGIQGAIPAGPFYELMSKLGDREVSVETHDVDGSPELRITAGRSKAGIKHAPNVLLPLDEMGLEKVKPNWWIDLPKNFGDAIRVTLPAAARTMSVPILCNLHFTNKFVEACDNYRITRYPFSKSKAFKNDILIRWNSVQALTKYDPVAYCEAVGWVHFKTSDDLIFSCRTSKGEYPDLGKFMKGDGETITLPAKLKDAVERADVMADGLVLVSITKDRIQVKGHGNAGWFEEAARVSYSGRELSFHIDAGTLVEIIKHLKTCTIEDRRMVFESETFTHIISIQPAE